jgi:gliding motility-associated-like protein
MASPAGNTTYTVTVTESVCNTSQILSTDITVLPLPVIRATKTNDIDCSNDQSTLGATGGTSYSWTPSSSLNNAFIPNPVANPVTNTNYYVIGTDADGCSNIDSVLVKVENINKGVYMMATGFTPNSDGLNDCFGIKYWGVIEELEFSIYNRWGERVFYTTDRSRCWDGTYKGVKQDANVYVYMIRAKTSCENLVFRKGTFVLIR